MSRTVDLAHHLGESWLDAQIATAFPTKVTDMTTTESNRPQTLWAMMTHPLFLEHGGRVVTMPHSVVMTLRRGKTDIGITLITDHDNESGIVAILWGSFLEGVKGASCPPA